MGDLKNSEYNELLEADLVGSDMIPVRDKSATAGAPGSGPGGAMKEIRADSLKNMGSLVSTINSINLIGIDTTSAFFNYMATAINAQGPFYCLAGQEFRFRAWGAPLLLIPDPDPEVTITDVKINNGNLSVGLGSPGGAVLPADILLEAQYTLNQTDNPDDFIDLGDLATLAVEDVFNLGDPNNPAGGGLYNAWVTTGDQLAAATLSINKKVYLFTGSAGSWGGINMGTGGIGQATAADFIDLSEQGEPPAVAGLLASLDSLGNLFSSGIKITFGEGFVISQSDPSGINLSVIDSQGVTCSDDTSNLAMAAKVFAFPAPYDGALEGFLFGANTGPTGADLTVDILVDGVSALSRYVRILDGETESSQTADISAAGVLTLTSNLSAGVAATGTLAATGNLLDGETVEIGGKTYTLQTTLTNVDGNVLIGATQGDTIDNLAAALDLSGVAGTDYALGMTAQGDVTGVNTADDLVITALVKGTAGDAITTTETSATASWGGATLAGGVAADTVTIGSKVYTLQDTLTNVDGNVLIGATQGDTVDNLVAAISLAAAFAAGLMTLSGNLSDGDTVTIGSKVYTLQTTLTNVDGNVLIGATQGDTVDNLAAATTLLGTPGTDYAAAMTAQGDVKGSNDGDNLVIDALVAGAAGNLIATTETSATASWAGAVLSGGVAGGYAQSMTAQGDVTGVNTADDLVITAITGGTAANSIATTETTAAASWGAATLEGGTDETYLIATPGFLKGQWITGDIKAVGTTIPGIWLSGWIYLKRN
tara:strand:+ start:15922 stop:18228 length:2307 start_codon:yes stop_codon:yes gene_type:complete